MTEDDKIRATNADTLRRDPTFQFAVLEARKAALEDLATIDPTNTDAIRAAQAKVKAIDQLTTELAAIIIRGTPQRQNPAV